ncbi:MAG: hypothetical protein ABJE66_30925 [Deltaproteobacteria bacterium]
MRVWAVLVLVWASPARAEDLSASAAVGAGAQGAETYGALELHLDQAWRDAHLDLGVRGVWDGGAFRRSDWASVADAVTIIRDFAATAELDDGGHLAIAAGRLAPSHVGRLVDGYRATLDDRWRTGVRAAAVTEDTDAVIELDDVLDPVVIASAVNYQVAAPWGAHLAVAIDPTAPALPMQTRIASSVEAGASYRIESETARTELGASIIAELGLGFTAVGYAESTIVRDDTRYTLRGDARGGGGTAGNMFGPLYRVERVTLWQRAHDGELQGGSLGATAGIAIPNGWLELGVRSRPGLGALATVNAGTAMAKRIQAAVWAAASSHDGAGAAELRIVWAKRLFNAVQAARIYQFTEPMQPAAVWSVTAWFGATAD